MVYTVTFNPALDYVVRMGSFRAGETNRTERDELQWGGKGINVSAVLHNLGVDNVAFGFLAGFTGQALDQALRESGVATDFIWLPEGLTRINVKIKAGQETEINGMGPAIPAAALEALFAKLDALGSGDVLVLAGSIPATLPDDVYQRILARLDGRDILTAVDATRDLLCAVLPYHPFLIKPNRDELGEIFGRTLMADREIEDCARQLQARGARNVLVSMAGDGSLLLDETGAVHRLGVPQGKVVNSVGAGDSMVAGFLAGWLEHRDYAMAYKLGAATGSATAFSDGLAEKEQVLKLLKEF
ncbi:1-phosphofructokinase [Pseudoflavonifractor sp. 524-17]|uniref:1-phosphofructokinase n=1 Tax=Pseudoflavonifractor sp. 524-17 TaxID=2304577 RepID=UPI0013797872|nr:1-phosphofructokinase [Pseudoflavonifractor sp. 524-17]NCE66150.1 1-phosphofructokinase [Pseudoflavonifractor sp. 524-17]